MSRRPEWFEDWLNNHWKHLTWKVNFMLGLLLAIFVAVLAKFITG